MDIVLVSYNGYIWKLFWLIIAVNIFTFIGYASLELLPKVHDFAYTIKPD